MPSCSHGLCNNNSMYRVRPEMKDVTFHRFPDPLKEFEKCRRWVEACNRLDFEVQNIGRSTYICSKHFFGSDGPTELFPDPCFATETEIPSNRTRKRLRITSPEQLALKQAEFNSYVLERSKLIVAQDEDCTNQNSVLPLESTTESTIPSLQTADTVDNHSLQNSTVNSSLLALLKSRLPQPPRKDPPVKEPPTIPEKFYKEMLRVDMPEGWTTLYKKPCLHFFKIENESIVATLKLESDMRLVLTVLGKQLAEGHPVSSHIESQLVFSVNNILSVLRYLTKWHVCPGNVESEFLNLVIKHNYLKDCDLITSSCSLRSYSCELLIKARQNANQCKKCSLLKARLKTAVEFRKRTTYSTKAHSKNMPMEELQRRLEARKAILNDNSRRLARLHKKYEQDVTADTQYVITVLNTTEEK